MPSIQVASVDYYHISSHYESEKFYVPHIMDMHREKWNKDALKIAHVEKNSSPLHLERRIIYLWTKGWFLHSA